MKTLKRTRMNLIKRSLPIIGLVVGLLCGAEAQESERLYPFVELTDADLAQIDVTDGSVDEWVDLLGEPTLTALDFQIPPDWPPYDPADMDYRVWLAWHGATQRIYVAVERADDIYINNYEDDGTIRACDRMSQHDSSVMFNVDGDASGGEYRFSEGRINIGAGFDEERRLRVNQHAQGYVVLGDIVGGGPHVCLPAQSAYNDEDWFQRPPYAEGGGASFGEQPTLSVTEFYVTPFDRLIWNSPEESVVSALSPGTLIGFFLGIADFDEEGALLPEGWHSIRAQDQWTGTTNADIFARGLLVGPGGELPNSAVESLTWGRIKATFVR